MENPLKNKKGVSLAELVAAIVIIGLASTTLTSMIITTHRGQLRATDYLLANEVANTYLSVFSRDVQKANLSTIEASAITSTDQNDKYITVSQELLSSLTKVGTEESQTYKLMYDTTSSLTLNGKKYNSSNVTIRFHLINIKVGFETQVIVTYGTSKAVTKNGRQFFI